MGGNNTNSRSGKDVQFIIDLLNVSDFLEHALHSLAISCLKILQVIPNLGEVIEILAK